MKNKRNRYLCFIQTHAKHITGEIQRMLKVERQFLVLNCKHKLVKVNRIRWIGARHRPWPDSYWNIWTLKVRTSKFVQPVYFLYIILIELIIDNIIIWCGCIIAKHDLFTGFIVLITSKVKKIVFLTFNQVLW